MPQPVFHKLYVLLGAQGELQPEVLIRALSGLLSHSNLTANLYLVSGDLPSSIPEVHRIGRCVSEFLKAHLFARLYVHLCHPVPLEAADEIARCYRDLKPMGREFDREGYLHQEVPRLMVLPVLIPEQGIRPASLIGLLRVLKEAFLMPSLYLDRATLYLARDEAVVSETGRVYYGHGTAGARDAAEVVCDLQCQDVLDDSCSLLPSAHVSMDRPCPAALIVSAQDGMLYGCMNAYRNKRVLADIHNGTELDSLISIYSEHREATGGCLACRERVVEAFSGLSLPGVIGYEVGALLYHFGALHQGAEEYALAAEKYRQSLPLSPPEEEGPICFRLGLCYAKTGRYGQAVEAFGRAESTYSDEYSFYFHTGVCRFGQGDYRLALEEFSKAARLNPQPEDLGRILLYMGVCHNSLADYEEAIAHLERARAAAGHIKEVYSALGFSLFQLKRYDSAILYLRKAVEMDPSSAVDYASLGSNYREKGDAPMAVAMYRKALQLDPDMTSARENLDLLGL